MTSFVRTLRIRVNPTLGLPVGPLEFSLIFTVNSIWFGDHVFITRLFPRGRFLSAKSTVMKFAAHTSKPIKCLDYASTNQWFDRSEIEIFTASHFRNFGSPFSVNVNHFHANRIRILIPKKSEETNENVVHSVPWRRPIRKAHVTCSQNRCLMCVILALRLQFGLTGLFYV